MPETYGQAWPRRVSESLENLRVLGRRAWLALLGIAVGCAAVVALLNIGHSAAQHARQLYQGMGSELMIADLSPAADSDGPSGLSLSALPADIRVAAPVVMTVTAAQRGERRREVMVTGSTAQLALVLDLQADEGRLLSVHDDASPHVMLGAALAQELGARVGDRLQLGSYLFDVVGVLAPRSANPMLPMSADDAVFMPLAGMRRLLPKPEVGTVLALGLEATTLPLAARVLGDSLRTRLPGHEVEVRLPRQLLEGMANQSRVFTWLLVGFAGIALLVGGVGVMNVMVMNVAERRREIGVRRALGARAQDIAWSFLLEAMLLSVTGALLGALVGVLAAWLFVLFSGWRFALDILSVPVGVVGSIAVGVFFGLQPALAAARLQPLVALRDD